MNRLIIATAGFYVLLASTVAHAQRTTPDFGPEDATAPVSVVEGAGVKIGEGTVLHPVVGLETGFVSNVFYQATDASAAGLLRLLVEAGTGSLPPARLAAPGAGENVKPNLGSFVYRADARLSYDFYLSNNERITDQGGLGGGLSFRGIVNPMETWQFYFQEDFARVIRATNFESAADTNRDINDLRLALAYRPRGRSLSGLLHYENRLDLFEEDAQQFANRFQHLVGLRVDWQWLPLTRVYIDPTIGYYSGIGDSTKATTVPMSITAGIVTALTVKTAVIARAGFAHSAYDVGPGYNAAVVGADYIWKYSDFGTFGATYAYQHDDSINANFYRDHLFKLSLEQHFVPFAVVLQPELRLRHYEGVTQAVNITGPDTRNDLIAAVLGEIHYAFRDWIAATVSYRLGVVSTDYRYMDMGGGTLIDPSFVRHELLLGVRAAL